MTIAELLDPLEKYNIQYIKVYTGKTLHIFDLSQDNYSDIYRWFGNSRVREWRTDFGCSLYIKI